MYGLIGSLIAKPGQRDTLVAAITDASHDLPGNLSYVVAEDASDDVTVWVTEVWESQEAHAASLALPHVGAAIARGRDAIAQMGTRVETRPR